MHTEGPWGGPGFESSDRSMPCSPWALSSAQGGRGMGLVLPGALRHTAEQCEVGGRDDANYEHRPPRSRAGGGAGVSAARRHLISWRGCLAAELRDRAGETYGMPQLNRLWSPPFQPAPHRHAIRCFLPRFSVLSLSATLSCLCGSLPQHPPTGAPIPTGAAWTDG